MSHFALLVFLGDLLPTPADRATVEGTLEAVLEPFHAATAVARHVAPCSCRGVTARARVYAIVLAQCQSADAFRTPARAPATTLRDPVDAGVAAWLRAHPHRATEALAVAAVREELTAPLTRALDALLALQPDADAPIPDCPACQGRGVVDTTANPDAQFDAWTIGLPPSRAGAPSRLPEAILPAATLDPERTSAAVTAILTADGTWHDNLQRGWLGLTASEQVMPAAAFAAQKRALIAAHREGLAVVVSCHD